MNVHSSNFRDLAAAEFDTTTLLAHAAEQAIERRYEDFCIVDVDCHHYETEAFNEIIQYMDDPVLRNEARYQGMARPGIASADGSYQEIARPHHALSRPPHREGAADATPRHHADAALDGRHGRRHRLHVSDPDAQSCRLSARRGRGGSGAGLQPLALRKNPRRRDPASSRCSICRSTILKLVTGPCRNSASARA